MLDRVWIGSSNRATGPRSLGPRKPPRRNQPIRMECLEDRLVPAALAPISTVTVPATLGYQVPLNGSAANAPQTFTVTSSNPDIPATVATGEFLTLNITHTAASGNPNDISFSGPITFQLFQDLTPNTVSEIESFVTSGFYNGKKFHRVANNFPGPNDYIVQGGSASGDGSGTSGQPGTPFPDEFNQQLAFTGTYQVAMANAGPNTNDTQFFITTGSPRSLDFGYTLFGQVVSGQDIVNDMTKVALTSGTTTPASPILISTATLSTTNPNGVVHIDATHAKAGESSTITVTATEPSNHTTTTQTFTVNAVANTQQERPFVNQMANQTVGKGQTFTFQIPAVSPTPSVPLAYTIQGGVTTSTSGTTFTPVQNATATVNQTTGVVTVVPNAGFTGPITLLYGVRNATLPDQPSSYQYHTFTLNVSSSATPTTLPPIAVAFSQTVPGNTATKVALSAQNTNPGTSPTFTFAITSQPANGTISQFNPQTGTLTYTPNHAFSGTDRFQYTVTATSGSSSLTSLPSTVTLNVQPIQTGAVRLIGTVLIVTPPPTPRTGSNTIVVSETSDSTNPLIQVTINGVLDGTQPAASNLSQIIVYGSKGSDHITVDPSVNVPSVTLDGGHGGRNVLQAGGKASTRMHGWFGLNTMIGSTGPNQMVGRAGHVQFRPTATTTEIFAGVPHRRNSHGHPVPPGGTFFRFANGQLIPIPLSQLSRTPVSGTRSMR